MVFGWRTIGSPVLEEWRERKKGRGALAMIKQVMAWLDGSAADIVRLEVANSLAKSVAGQVVGLFLNPIPRRIAKNLTGSAAIQDQLTHLAEAAGDETEARLTARLAALDSPTEFRRIDVAPDEVAEIASREARYADTFVALKGQLQESAGLLESVLFGSGRHLFLATDEKPFTGFERVLIAWDGSRESARAVAESLPYLSQAGSVSLIIVDGACEGETRDTLAAKALKYLSIHGVEAKLRDLICQRAPANTLIREAQAMNANVIVMGAYGHSRLSRWVLDDLTSELLQEASMPTIVAY